jgi:regulatory protein
MTSPDDATASPFVSAEDWLAERGVTREPIRVPVRPSEDPAATTAGHGPAPGNREVARLAREAPVPAPPADPSADAPPPPDDAVEVPAGEPGVGNLEDEIARALVFIRRSTSAQPAAEGRLRRKLAERGSPRAAVEPALRRARQEGLVDDAALVAALVEERRAIGHAASRIRHDLRRRELPDDLVDRALERFADEDPEAAAFAVARDKARSYAGLDTDTAFRRLVGHLVRRGHAEHLARKVARQVLWDDREHERVVGH